MPPTPKKGSLKKVATAAVKKPTANKVVKPTADSTAYYQHGAKRYGDLAIKTLNAPIGGKLMNEEREERNTKANKYYDASFKATDNALRQSRKGKPGYNKNGFPLKKNKVGGTVKSKKK
jgi:hypothetical protein